MDEFFTYDSILDEGGPLSIENIFKVYKVVKWPAPIRVFKKEDMKHFYNVLSRDHQTNGSQVCPFGSCTPKGCTSDRCMHDHSNRTEEWCQDGKLNTENCKSGAFCSKRHANDEYVMCFFDRMKSVYKFYMWKDRRSKFSHWSRDETQ